MKQLFHRLLDFVLFSNVFIAFGAVAAAATTYLELGYTPSVDVLLIFIFSATLFIYIFQRIMGLRLVGSSTVLPRHQFYKDNRGLLIIIMLVSGLGAFCCLFYMPWRLIVILPVAAIIAIIYGIPFRGNKVFRFRDLPYLKIFLITLVWAFVSTILPASFLGHPIGGNDVLLIFIERAFFIFSITLPFDIRDRLVDQKVGVLTIAHFVSAQTAKYLSFTALVMAFLLASILHSEVSGYESDVALLAGLACTYFITGVIIGMGKHHYGDRYYLGALDGMLILQFVLVYAFVNILTS